MCYRHFLKMRLLRANSSDSGVFVLIYMLMLQTVPAVAVATAISEPLAHAMFRAFDVNFNQKLDIREIAVGLAKVSFSVVFVSPCAFSFGSVGANCPLTFASHLLHFVFS